MSHVVSSQPTSTSANQPTEPNPPAISATVEPEGDQVCCIHPDKSQCCLVYCCCSVLSFFFRGIRDCCQGCANFLNNCCEDKPDEKKRREYRKKRIASLNFNDEITWEYDYQPRDLAVDKNIVTHGTSVDDSDKYTSNAHCANNQAGKHHSVGDNFTNHNSSQCIVSYNTKTHDSGIYHSSWYHSSNNPSSNHHSSKHHSSKHHSINTHSSDHHSNNYHSSNPHSSDHHSNNHNSSDHHSSNHHSSDHHSSSHHDSGGHHDTGGYCDSGWGGDSGGGDYGGGDCGGGGADD